MQRSENYNISDLLTYIKNKREGLLPLTTEIEKEIEQIKSISKNFAQIWEYNGRAAMNRKLLSNPQINCHLTPAVISYLCATANADNAPSIQANIRGARTIKLYDVLFYGLENPLALKYMPNIPTSRGTYNYNEQQYEEQKSNYPYNLIKNIYEAANLPFSANHFATMMAITNSSLIALPTTIRYIEEVIQLFHQTNRAYDLHVIEIYKTQSRFNPASSKNVLDVEVKKGFDHLLDVLLLNDENFNLDTINLGTFCDLFLTSPKALLNAQVSYLFYDRAHLLAAFDNSDDRVKIGNVEYTFRDIFTKMLEKLIANPDNYPDCAKEQIYLRFMLVKADLEKRLTEKEALLIEKSLQNPMEETDNCRKAAVSLSSLKKLDPVDLLLGGSGSEENTPVSNVNNNKEVSSIENTPQNPIEENTTFTQAAVSFEDGEESRPFPTPNFLLEDSSSEENTPVSNVNNNNVGTYSYLMNTFKNSFYTMAGLIPTPVKETINQAVTEVSRILPINTSYIQPTEQNRDDDEELAANSSTLRRPGKN